MESVNSPYTPKNYENRPDRSRDVILPSVPAGPSEYPSLIPQITPNIPSFEYQDKNQKKIVDLQVYEQKKPNFLADKQANIALQPLALSSPFMPPQFQSYMNNMMKNFYTPFIYKDYNINIGGPNADRLQATVLYEDILPPSDIFTSYKSLKERNNLLDYIRSTFITRTEGENKNFKGDGPNSLNSRLKLVELTPNNPSIWTNNPYKASPRNFLLYHSCYPITFDKNAYGSQCSKSSVGLNLRVYNLYTGEIINLHNNYNFLDKIFPNTFIAGNIPYDDMAKFIKNRKSLELKYNTIRDLKYYEFIRNEICKNKISPNFVQSYCYFLDEETKLTFNKNSTGISGTTFNFSDETDKIYENRMEQLLIILTESPEYSLKYWCSNSYVQDRNVRRQSTVGYKSDKVWDSIIAQILLSFYVMLKYKFVIDDMTLEDNFYIKNVSLYNQANQYWIYNINGINYYIPNTGYLLMIDHNYHDNINSFDAIPSSSINLKILSSKFIDSDSDIKNKIYDNLLKCLNISNFILINQDDKVIIPDDSKKLFNDIKRDLDNITKSNFSIKEYEKQILYKYLANFVHNRVGTDIRDLEKINISKDSISPFRPGEISIYEEKYDTYKIVLFLEIEINSNNNYKCITRDKGVITEISIDKGNLHHYSSSGEIYQDIKPGDSSFTIDNLIETYII
jgi:hypothetical protein